MKFSKQMLIVGAISVLVAIVAMPIAGIALRTKWEEIGSPPNPAIQILAISPELILSTSKGDTYQSCGSDCWDLFTLPELPPTPQWFEPECPHAEIPELSGSVDLKIECEVYGPTLTYRAYSVDADGIVYRWEEQGSEWSWAGPIFFGGVAGIVVIILGTAIVALLSFNDLLDWLQKRAQRLGGNELGILAISS